MLLSIKPSVKRIIPNDFQMLFGQIEIAVILFFAQFDAISVLIVQFAPSPFFGQQRMFFDFDSPSLIVSQMPVKFIQFVSCHQIQEMFDFILGIKMTTYVQMCPSIIVFWKIFHFQKLHFGLAYANWNQLLQSGYRHQNSCRRNSADSNSVG
ncbi:hypothetical protein D3C84_726250 [compost metagenome]